MPIFFLEEFLSVWIRVKLMTFIWVMKMHINLYESIDLIGELKVIISAGVDK